MGFKGLLASLILLVSSTVYGFELNSASSFELESTRGIGQKLAQTIVVEREAHGPFKDWNDFKMRVNGIGDKSLKKLQNNGLTLNNKNTTTTQQDSK